MQGTLALAILSLALLFAGIGTSFLAIVVLALYRKVESVASLSVKVDALDSAYRSLRASKAQAARIAPVKGVAPVIAEALNDLDDETRRLFQ